MLGWRDRARACAFQPGAIQPDASDGPSACALVSQMPYPRVERARPGEPGGREGSFAHVFLSGVHARGLARVRALVSQALRCWAVSDLLQ